MAGLRLVAREPWSATEQERAALGLEMLWEAGKPVALFPCPGERRPEPFPLVTER